MLVLLGSRHCLVVELVDGSLEVSYLPETLGVLAVELFVDVCLLFKHLLEAIDVTLKHADY
jgi:hypothetical protein